jgi:formiminoglutamase
MLTPSKMTFVDIFAYTQRPDPALFYRRGDANDPRLGEVVQADPAAYADAALVLLGCPQDEGVRRNQGRPGASRAPDEIRRCFYRLAVANLLDNPNMRLFDLGNTISEPTLEETHTAHREIVRQIIRDGKTLVVLGGGNDTSYPDCSALALESESLLAFNVDAHFDVRADATPNSGTPYRQLLEESYLNPDQFYEVGYQPFASSPVYLRYLAYKGVHVISLRELQAAGIDAFFQHALQQSAARAIFWGLDMDVVRAADAPGVSAPNPTGMDGADLCRIAEIAGRDTRSRILELTEVNPDYDIDGRTCRLAAVVIFSFLLGVRDRTNQP